MQSAFQAKYSYTCWTGASDEGFHSGSFNLSAASLPRTQVRMMEPFLSSSRWRIDWVAAFACSNNCTLNNIT